MVRGKRRSRAELDELSVLLLDLRARADLPQAQVAAELNVSPATLSRMESGRKVPSAEDAATLADIYHARPDERRKLMELVEVMAPMRIDSRMHWQRSGPKHWQERYREMERTSRLLRAYSPAMILGTVQTSDYARQVFRAPHPRRPDLPAEVIEAEVAERGRRWEQLSDGTRTWVLIMGQAALEWQLGDQTVMADQMRRLLDASELPNVQLGIIPAFVQLTMPPYHAFDTYDERGVCVGTLTATAVTTDERDVRDYLWLFERLKESALFGDEARQIITNVARERYS